MKIAVTGATGFVGRHVLAELAMHDVEIIAIARPNHTDLSPIEKGRWVHLDITQLPANLFKVIGEPNVLIHLAWQNLPNYRSLSHFETELPCQYAFVKQMIIQGLKSLLVTGTCFEYGMQSGPLSETMRTRPENPYGFAKDALRKQLEYLQNTSHPFNLVWARLFYMFGEGQAKSSLFSLFNKVVTQGAKQFNMSAGEQLRDYLPVSEVARYLVALAIKQKNVGTINICSGKPQSVRNLVESWIEENSCNIELNLGYYPYPDYEPMAFWGDRQKLGDLLRIS